MTVVARTGQIDLEKADDCEDCKFRDQPLVVADWDPNDPKAATWVRLTPADPNSWVGGAIRYSSPYVRGAVGADGMVYAVTFADGGTNLGFHQGEVQGDGTVSWTIMLDGNNPLEVDLVLPALSHIDDFLALPEPYNKIEPHPQLAADPLDPNALYLVYHDLAQAPAYRADEDVNVYFRKLTRVSGS